MKKTAYVLSIIYAIFLSILALDEIGNSVLGFLIHMIPSFIVAAVFLISRRYQFIGALLFGILFILSTAFFRTYQDIVVFLIVSFPLGVISFLLVRDSKD